MSDAGLVGRHGTESTRVSSCRPASRPRAGRSRGVGRHGASHLLGRGSTRSPRTAHHRGAGDATSPVEGMSRSARVFECDPSAVRRVEIAEAVGLVSDAVFEGDEDDEVRMAESASLGRVGWSLGEERRIDLAADLHREDWSGRGRRGGSGRRAPVIAGLPLRGQAWQPAMVHEGFARRPGSGYGRRRLRRCARATARIGSSSIRYSGQASPGGPRSRVVLPTDWVPAKTIRIDRPFSRRRFRPVIAAGRGMPSMARRVGAMSASRPSSGEASRFAPGVRRPRAAGRRSWCGRSAGSRPRRSTSARHCRDPR